jgi:hypothetical protein
MATVLEEVTSEALDKAHVERRVDDWVSRLHRLYAEIQSWLPSAWSAQPGIPVLMHEELMREFGVPERELPTLKLFREEGEAAYIEPRTLWIVPHNGMIVFERNGTRFIIVDTAENFRPPKWEVTADHDRSQREPLTREWLQRILR